MLGRSLYSPDYSRNGVQLQGVIIGRSWLRDFCWDCSGMSTYAGRMPLSVPAARSEVSVRVHLGLGPTVLGRSGSAFPGRLVFGL